MATDITTLAIQIQSQEAERNLRTFNELLSLSSTTAQKMEKVSIAIDANEALAQLQSLKAGYNDLAAAAQNVHFDVGVGAISPDISSVDTGALDALKEFFATSAEMSKAFREEMVQINEAILQLEANSIKVSTAGGDHAASMSGRATVSREYAAAVREVAAAQKELEKATAQADQAMRDTIAADDDAAAVKKKLIAAQQELTSVEKQLAGTHSGMGGDIIELTEKEDALKNKVAELQRVYEEAQAAAEKFNQKLEDSGAKADAARAKYNELKGKLDTMPQPVENMSGSVDDVSAKFRLAGRNVTKLTRGISGLTSMAGAAIPGISGLGRVISMLGLGNPYLIAAGLAIAGIAAVVKGYQQDRQEELAGMKAYADLQGRITDRLKEERQQTESYMARLIELNNAEVLNNSEKAEALTLVEKLNSAVSGLGLTYDQVTGKTANLAEATRQLNEEMARKTKEQLLNQLNTQKHEAIALFGEIQNEFSSWGFSTQNVTRVEKRIAQARADFNNALTADEQLKILDNLSASISDYRELYGGRGSRIMNLGGVADAIEKARGALEKVRATEAALEEENDKIGSRRTSEVNRSKRALDAQLEAAREALMTPEELYNLRADKISALEQEMSRISREQLDYENNENTLTYYDNAEVTTGEALRKIQIEITKLTGEQLTYEKQLEATKAREAKQQEAERAREAKQLEAAQKQFAAGRRNYVYDAQGNIVREKSDSELDMMRQMEIAQAREKVAAAGSAAEYYQAQTELDRLLQEDFRKRQEISFANLGFSQMQAHNNMVRGVAAHSSNALQLASRNFNKPDNAWKTLEKRQAQIYNLLADIAPLIDMLSLTGANIADKVSTV